jgi:rhodanese-related sulfurtransferase
MVMTRTFQQMVAEAIARVPTVDPAEAQRRMEADPNILVIDVRDAADLAGTGIIPGAVNISLGTLTYKADHEVPAAWRDPRFADRDRPIITTCEVGAMAALGAELLTDMGYTNVVILEGGTQGWKEAGLPTVPPGDAQS